MTTKTEVAAWERKQLGYVEGPGNKTKFAKIAGHANGYAWCATFQVAAFRSCGMKLGNESAYCPSLMNSLSTHEVQGPQPGALGFLYFPLMGRVAHVVLVESVRPDGRFVTIEGNTDVAGGRTGGMVMRKVRSAHNFRFFMPQYSEPSVSSHPHAPTPAPAPSGKIGDLVFPVIRRGSKGQAVRNLQGLLLAAGRAIEIDGDFGPGSERVLRKHQAAAGLAVDGVAGDSTWRQLLGV